MIRSIILVLVGGLFLLQAIRSLRAMRLKEQYALLFILVSIPFLLLAIWPRGIELISQWLKIEQQTVMILALGTFLLILLFKLTSIISVQERRILSLTQHVAILMQRQDLIASNQLLEGDHPFRPLEQPDVAEPEPSNEVDDRNADTH